MLYPQVPITTVLACVLLCPNPAPADEQDNNITSLSEILPDRAWPERRQEITHRWLELLGPFPEEVPDLQPEMKQVEQKDGPTRYHISFQAEADDRLTAWLLVPLRLTSERIIATVSNGGMLDWWRQADAWSRQPSTWTPWRKGIDPPSSSKRLEERFGFKTNSGPYIYIKQFRPYIDDPSKQIPVDFDSLMALVAPARCW